MSRRKKTDGERIAYEVLSGRYQGMACPTEIAAEVDCLIRRRMAEAWDLGRTYGINNIASDANPYRGRRSK